MKDDHILDILDKQTFEELSQAEKNLVEDHTAECSKCLLAYQTARISSVLLKTGVPQNFEPSPFFVKRVLANLPEEKNTKPSFWGLGRFWKASGSLVALMITTVLVLIATTVFAPNYSKVSANENDSAEIVILDEKLPSREINNEQFFQMIYGADSNKEK